MDGGWRREEGRRGEGRGIKTTWMPGFRLWFFCSSVNQSTGFVHLIITSTRESIVCAVFRVAPSLYFYSPRVIHPTESLRQSSLNNKVNMSDWSAPASGTPCWISIPAAEVARGRCQLYPFLARFACSAATRSYILHLNVASAPPSFIITTAPANQWCSQAILHYSLQLGVHAPGDTQRGLPS
jgi:hypothetical protein